MTSNPQRPLRLVAAGVLLLLAGCAGTHAKNVQSTHANTATPTPYRVAVVVENRSVPPKRASRQAAQAAEADEMVRTLRARLTTLLAQRGLTVVAASAHPDLTLRCDVLEVRSGNEWLRVLIGYGAGRAALRTHVTLLDATRAATNPLLGFDVESTSGKLPGAGFGLASGQALAQGGAALSIPGAMKQGLALEVSDSLSRVDDELREYFREEHWPYAAATTANASHP